MDLYDSGKCPTCKTDFDSVHFANLRTALEEKKLGFENIKAEKRQSKNFKYEPIDETAASAILAKLRSYLLNK